LFFLSYLQKSEEARQRLGPVFKDRVMERFGAEADLFSFSSIQAIQEAKLLRKMQAYMLSKPSPFLSNQLVSFVSFKG